MSLKDNDFSKTLLLGGVQIPGDSFHTADITAQIWSDLTDHNLYSLLKSFTGEESGTKQPLSVVKAPLDIQSHNPCEWVTGINSPLVCAFVQIIHTSVQNHLVSNMGVMRIKGISSVHLTLPSTLSSIFIYLETIGHRKQQRSMYGLYLKEVILLFMF